MADAALKFEEIKSLMTAAEHPSCSARRDFDSMNKVERIQYWLNFSADRTVSEVQRPRVSVYAASHGFAQGDKESREIVDKLLAGSHAVNDVVNFAQADLRLYDMNMDQPTQDITSGLEAMDEEGLLNSLAYGLMTIEPENDLIAISAIGPGSEEVAKSFCGYGDTVKANAEELSLESCFSILKSRSGFELNAVIGAIIAARLAKIPLILEGYAGLAAMRVLTKLNPDNHWHCAFALKRDENYDAIKSEIEDMNWLVLDNPSPYGYEVSNDIDSGLHIAAIKQLLSLKQ